MIHITDKSTCCGCTACANACPHNAIKMEPDVLGFLYPLVDVDTCVNCGLCDIICQFKKDYKDYSLGFHQTAYAFRLGDDTELMKSQSGGAFYEIARHIIQNGGIVYGAGFDEDLNVTHIRASNLEQLANIRLTKYVQSKLGLIYQMVLTDLKAQNIVLFSGTGCQVAGLKSFIPMRYHKNLVTIDLICHGVPSPAIWQDYLGYMQNKQSGKVIETHFRDKSFGWKTTMQSFKFSDGNIKFGKTSNYLYFQGYTIRDSCNICPFANLRRVSDITVGDFWGWQKVSDKYDDNKGISLILVNTGMGAKIISKVSKYNFIQEHKISDCIQPQLIHPTAQNPKRDRFIEDYSQRGFVYIAKKYGDLGFSYRMTQFKQMIKSILLHRPE